MLITRMSYGRTVQVKQYEPEKIEIDFVPSGENKPDEAMAEAIGFVDQHFDNIVANRNGTKPKSTAPPKKNDKAKAEDKPAPKKRGRPHGSKKAKKVVKMSASDALASLDDAVTLKELGGEFNKLRENVKESFSIDEWSELLDKLRERYRDLNTIDASDEDREAVIAAAKAEREWIANARLAEAA